MFRLPGRVWFEGWVGGGGWCETRPYGGAIASYLSMFIGVAVAGAGLV